MRELREGLWHWQAPHPEWSPGRRWRREVSSYALDDGERLLLFDPLAVPRELRAAAADREPVVVLTAPWHERDARTLVEQLGATLVAPAPDSAQDLMDKFGITAEQAGDGSPDLRWVRGGGADVRWYAAGDRLPAGIAARAGREPNDLVLWVPSVGALVAGDTLADFGDGLAVTWREGGPVAREHLVERLRPLLDLPVEIVCAAHGAPAGRAALERALAR